MQAIFFSSKHLTFPDKTKVPQKIGAKNDAISFSALLDLQLDTN
jgi:hypothetical protein